MLVLKITICININEKLTQTNKHLNSSIFKAAKQNNSLYFCFLQFIYSAEHINCINKQLWLFLPLSFSADPRNFWWVHCQKSNSFKTRWFIQWHFSMIIFQKLYTVFPYSYGLRLLYKIKCWQKTLKEH